MTMKAPMNDVMQDCWIPWKWDVLFDETMEVWIYFNADL